MNNLWQQTVSAVRNMPGHHDATEANVAEWVASASKGMKDFAGLEKPDHLAKRLREGDATARMLVILASKRLPELRINNATVAANETPRR